VAIFQNPGDDVVAIREHVGGDDDLFAGRPLDGEAAPINLRLDVFDDDALDDRWRRVLMSDAIVDGRRFRLSRPVHLRVPAARR
jgi:hypothetical protein